MARSPFFLQRPARPAQGGAPAFPSPPPGMTGFRILGGGSLASSLDLRYTRKSALALPPGKLRPASMGPLPKRPCTERADAPRPARRPTEAYPRRYGEGGQRSRRGCSGPRMPGSEGMAPWMPAPLPSAAPPTAPRYGASGTAGGRRKPDFPLTGVWGPTYLFGLTVYNMRLDQSTIFWSDHPPNESHEMVG